MSTLQHSDTVSEQALAPVVHVEGLGPIKYPFSCWAATVSTRSDPNGVGVCRGGGGGGGHVGEGEVGPELLCRLLRQLPPGSCTFPKAGKHGSCVLKAPSA